MFCTYFLLFCILFCHFLIMSLDTQSLKFWWSQIYFLLLLLFMLLMSYLKICCWIQGYKDLPLCFLLSFVLLALISGSLIYFDLIYIYINNLYLYIYILSIIFVNFCEVGDQHDSFAGRYPVFPAPPVEKIIVFPLVLAPLWKSNWP